MSGLTIEELKKDLQMLEEAAEPNLPLGMEEFDPGFRLACALDDLAKERMRSSRVRRLIPVLKDLKGKLEHIHNTHGIVEDMDRFQSIERSWKNVLSILDDILLIEILFRDHQE